MRRFLKYTILVLIFLLASCKNETRIIEVEIIGESKNINNKINICLDDSIGYVSLDLNFKIELNDDSIINEETTIYGHLDNEKKCFELFLGAKFLGKGDSKEYMDSILKIFKGNIKLMVIDIYESGNLISSSEFKDL